MQETGGASGLATAAVARTADSEVEALRQELVKWQERVPKLAGALRERTGEVEALRKELAALAAARATAAADSSPDRRSGIEARDALIEELETKVRALGGKYQDAEGQLRTRDLEIGQLRQDAAEWREKWQSVTAALDAQADCVDQKDREFARLKQEVDELLTGQASAQARIKSQDLELTALRERTQSLESRNENLFETTELANRQIETLGESLDHLRSELASSKEALASHEKRAGDSLQEIDDLKGQLAGRDQDIGALQRKVEEKQADLEARQEEVRRLESQLSDRSDLVVELEAENRACSSRIRSLEAENTGLSEALEKARQAAAGNADHIAGVDARLERQKQLMDNLEAEFAEVQEALSEARKAHQREIAEKDAELVSLRETMSEASVTEPKPEPVESAEELTLENAALQSEVVKLEGVVRERTEQLNKLRWQQDMIEKQSSAAGSGNKMLVVLNQQLQSARDDNQLLKERIRSLEAAAAEARNEASALSADEGAEEEPDDLSRIRGVGPKLVKQLRNLGFTRFDQIAALSDSDLDDEDHALHRMKGRILRDNWIQQAAELGGIG